MAASPGLSAPSPDGRGIFLNFAHYLFTNRISFGQYIVVPKAHHSKTKIFHTTRTIDIVKRSTSMMVTIGFDYQSGFHTTEIGKKDAHRKLTTKLEPAKLSVTQTRPKFLLRFSLISSQFSSRALALPVVCQLGALSTWERAERSSG